VVVDLVGMPGARGPGRLTAGRQGLPYCRWSRAWKPVAPATAWPGGRPRGIPPSRSAVEMPVTAAHPPP